MIVFDITSMESFLNVKSWLELLSEHFDLSTSKNHTNEEAFILVGNKADLESQR